MRPDRSVGRLRERQYQLAAQKHNETFLKYNYYQQTARYFERECGIARHYDSWNYKDADPKGQIEKARKAETLKVRRKKLSFLLKEEEEGYKKELEKLTAKKNRSKSEEPTLEVLERKLREKKAEQSLYLPRTCRRYQSYFVCPTESAGAYWNSFKDSEYQRSRACRETTNLLNRYEQKSRRNETSMSTDESKISKEQENLQTQYEMTMYPHDEEEHRPNPKYTARYSRKSLEYTNVRNDDPEERASSPEGQLHTTTPTSDSLDGKYVPDLEIINTDESPSTGRKSEGPEEVRAAGKPSSPSTNDHQEKHGEEYSHRETLESHSNKNSNSHQEETSSEKISNLDTDEVDRSVAKKDAQDRKDLNVTDSRQFESERSLPWLRMDPNDKNLSKQMFLYLTHKELKCKIEDLAKRELHACTKQSWDEALRLRDMRNRLELIREKRLYNTDDLELGEEERKIGLANINKREEELAHREHACTDSTMYSEEAKALWKQWVHEDEGSVIKDARLQRETLMNRLEKEWQGLAIRDKEKITQSFQHVISDSALQEEHKLAAALSAARMKSLSSPSKEY